MKCADTAILYEGVGLTSDQYTRELYIKNSWIHTEKEKNALFINNSHVITIDNSYVYMPYASKNLIYVKGKLDWMTVTGKSRIGGGTIQTSNPQSLIYYDDTYTGTLNIQMLQNAIIMGGTYNRTAICTRRNTILRFLDESEIYNNYNNSSATCIIMEGNSNNSQIDVNTTGWLYSCGNNVIYSDDDFTFNYSRGSFAQKSQNVDNKSKVQATQSRNRFLYYMDAYNHYGGNQANNMYYRGKYWVKDGETEVYGWRYYNSDGSVYTGLYHSDHYYYLENSVLYIGWKQVGSDWYYFQGNIPNGLSVSDPISGSALEGGPYVLDSEKYIFGSDGKMLTGWQKTGGYWYYLQSSGKAKKGWFQDANNNNYWYYFEPSGNNFGQMLANTSRSINGKTYNFAADGHCTNP